MMTSLRDQVRAQLPEPVVKLWNTLEDFSGTQLVVEDLPEKYRADGHGNPAAMMAGHEGATLLIPVERPPSAEAVFHELLHAHRLWVEAVPELVILTEDENNWRIVGQIEGELEHLVIVPRQVAAGYGETARLSAEAQATWNAYPWPANGNPWARRKTCLLHWLAHHLFEDETTTQLIKRGVVAEKLFGEADLFRTKMLSLMGRKEDMLSCAVRFLKIPPQEVGIRYIDIRNRSFRIESLPRPR